MNDRTVANSVFMWERVANTTRWGAHISAIEASAIAAAAALADPPSAALEVGCEGGRWSVLLAHKDWSMTCTEVKSEPLRLCQRRIPGAKCVLVDSLSETLPCDSHSQRLLLCIEVPQVIGADWFLREASRVLAPGGVLVGVF